MREALDTAEGVLLGHRPSPRTHGPCRTDHPAGTEAKRRKRYGPAGEGDRGMPEQCCPVLGLQVGAQGLTWCQELGPGCPLTDVLSHWAANRLHGALTVPRFFNKNTLLPIHSRR